MVGFEVDNFTHELALRVLNGEDLSMPTTKSLRVSINPYDHKLRLGESLRRVLQRCTEALRYSEILGQVIALPTAKYCCTLQKSKISKLPQRGCKKFYKQKKI